MSCDLQLPIHREEAETERENKNNREAEAEADRRNICLEVPASQPAPLLSTQLPQRIDVQITPHIPNIGKHCNAPVDAPVDAPVVGMKRKKGGKKEKREEEGGREEVYIPSWNCVSQRGEGDWMVC